MSPRGGYRLWKACRGSNKMAGRLASDGKSGSCSVCGKTVAVFRDGTVVRHQAKKAEEDATDS